MITGPLHSGKNFIRHCSEKNTKKKINKFRYRCRRRKGFGSAKDFCRNFPNLPEKPLLRILPTNFFPQRPRRRFLCDIQKNVLLCFYENVGRHFLRSNNIGRHFCPNFQEFCQIFRDFTQIFRRFAQIFRYFVQILN